LVEFLQSTENTNDRWLRDGATSAAATHDRYFLPALAGGAGLPRSDQLLTVVSRVAEHGARGGSAESVRSLIAVLPTADVQLSEAVVRGLSAGWPKSRKITLTRDDERALVLLLERLAGNSKGQLVRLAATWGTTALKKFEKEIVSLLLSDLDKAEMTDAARSAAATRLIEFQPNAAGVVEQLLERVSPRMSPALTEGIISAVGTSRCREVGSILVKATDQLTPAARSAAVRVMLSRVEWTETLLEALESNQLGLSELRLDQKQALMAHPDKRIAGTARQLLAGGGGLPNPDRQKVLEQLLPVVDVSGDATAGRDVFKRECSKCHIHGSEGTRIGPDLTGMSVHPKRELLTRLMDPSRDVEGNFRGYTVVTVDGRIQSGLLASETGTSLELFDAEGKRHVILREDVDELYASPKSLMPDGFEKQVTKTELADLLEFLTTRGRYTMLNLRKAATIVSTRGMFHDESSTVERLVFDDWSPKTFEGVPFHVVDPRGARIPNVIMLYSPNGKIPPRMPRQVSLPVNQSAKAIHLLSGVGGWSAKSPRTNGEVAMIVRLHYADGSVEDHPLRDGEHFADYIGMFDVPGSRRAFKLRNQQVRYLAIKPKRTEPIATLDFVKGPDRSAPIVMAVTVE